MIIIPVTHPSMNSLLRWDSGSLKGFVLQPCDESLMYQPIAQGLATCNVRASVLERVWCINHYNPNVVDTGGY